MPVANVIVSSLTIHHLDGEGKVQLFKKAFRNLAERGVFVVSDIVEPATESGVRYAAEQWDIVMNNPDAFERILASLYDAMLDETRWPATSALMKARRTTSGLSSSGSTLGDSAAKTWSASTSKTTIPSTNVYRASGNCRSVAWCTSTTCTRCSR